MNKSLFTLLMNDDNVNLYTKFFIILYNIKKFNKENYIPNQLFMNRLKIDKYTTSKLINRMKKEKIITIYYINNKRYFDFRNIDVESFKNNNNKNYNDILSYDWLNEEEDL